jgi:hypothetical protein
MKVFSEHVIVDEDGKVVTIVPEKVETFIIKEEQLIINDSKVLALYKHPPWYIPAFQHRLRFVKTSQSCIHIECEWVPLCGENVLYMVFINGRLRQKKKQHRFILCGLENQMECKIEIKVDNEDIGYDTATLKTEAIDVELDTLPEIDFSILTKKECIRLKAYLYHFPPTHKQIKNIQTNIFGKVISFDAKMGDFHENNGADSNLYFPFVEKQSVQVDGTELTYTPSGMIHDNHLYSFGSRFEINGRSCLVCEGSLILVFEDITPISFPLASYAISGTSTGSSSLHAQQGFGVVPSTHSGISVSDKTVLLDHIELAPVETKICQETGISFSGIGFFDDACIHVGNYRIIREENTLLFQFQQPDLSYITKLVIEKS